MIACRATDRDVLACSAVLAMTFPVVQVYKTFVASIVVSLLIIGATQRNACKAWQIRKTILPFVFVAVEMELEIQVSQGLIQDSPRNVTVETVLLTVPCPSLNMHTPWNQKHGYDLEVAENTVFPANITFVWIQMGPGCRCFI